MSSHITVVRAADHLENFMDLIMKIQNDPLLGNTSLPTVEVKEKILDWADQVGWDIWIIKVDGTDAGIARLQQPNLTENPEPFKDHLEIDQYILPEYRGLGAVAAAWEQIFESLPKGTRLVGEVWSYNSPGIRQLEKNGWEYVGEYFWDDGNESGMCKRFVKTLL